MYVTLSTFHLYLQIYHLKLRKKIILKYVVILAFHCFHLRGQTKESYTKIRFTTTSNELVLIDSIDSSAGQYIPHFVFFS